MKRRPAKLPNLLEQVRAHLKAGRLRDTRHATDRQGERNISREEIHQVLETGRHEPSKDTFQPSYNAWNYAIRGRTIDRRELRVIVACNLVAAVVITAIDLTSNKAAR